MVIEDCFQNLKFRGFNLENIHMKILSRLSKLIAMVSIAYAFCGCNSLIGPKIT